jgi:hypothetical protein
MIENMKRKFQRITKALMGYILEGEPFLYSDEWKDIYRTVGGDGTFATDEAVNRFPHEVCTLDASEKVSVCNVLGFIFTTMYEETNRQGYPIETPCMADITDTVVMIRNTALDDCLMSSIIDVERGRRLGGHLYGHCRGGHCRDYVLCYNLVGCKDVRIYFVSHAGPNQRLTAKSLMAINNPIDIFDFDMVLIKLSSNLASNSVGVQSKWELCNDDFVPEHELQVKRERDVDPDYEPRKMCK